jgi:hypothetical protein
MLHTTPEILENFSKGFAQLALVGLEWLGVQRPPFHSLVTLMFFSSVSSILVSVFPTTARLTDPFP